MKDKEKIGKRVELLHPHLWEGLFGFIEEVERPEGRGHVWIRMVNGVVVLAKPKEYRIVQ